MNNDSEFEGDDGAEIVDDHDPIIYKVGTYGADFDIEGLVKRFQRNDIFKPKFQREYVWTIARASRFIESILLGLPIPQIFLYRDTDNRLLIVDGLQRLTTIERFSEGKLKLKYDGLVSHFNGLSYFDLTEDDRRRFDDSVIRATIVEQKAPSGDKQSVFHIFDRLNTSSTPLTPQEMRVAIYRGDFQDLLFKLNSNEDWRKIFGTKNKRLKDVEQILRFFAMLYRRDNYEPSLSKFLNSFSKENQELLVYPAEILESVFQSTVNRIVGANISKPFRFSASLNTAFMDSFMVAVAEHDYATSDDVAAAYQRLLMDEKFRGYVSDTTSASDRLKQRFRLAGKAFEN